MAPQPQLWSKREVKAAHSPRKAAPPPTRPWSIRGTFKGRTATSEEGPTEIWNAKDRRHTQDATTAFETVCRSDVSRDDCENHRRS